MARLLSLAALLVGGLMPSLVVAQSQPVCDRLWKQSSAAQQEDLHVSMLQLGLLEKDGRHYSVRNITEVIRQHVSANCSEAYNRLSAEMRTETGYMGYLLGRNPGLMPAGADGRVTIDVTIPKTQFMALIAGPGVDLGLSSRTTPPRRQAAAAAAPRRTPAAPKRAAPRPVRHNVVPGCSGCVTAASD